MVEVDEGVSRPEPFAHRIASDHLTRALEEHREQLKRLFLQLEPDAVAPELPRLEIDFEGAEPHTRRDRRPIGHRCPGVYRRPPATSKEFTCAANNDRSAFTGSPTLHPQTPPVH